MSHKDWKGPGFYNCWDNKGVWAYVEMKEHMNDLACHWTYRKLENFTPPECPKPKTDKEKLDELIAAVECALSKTCSGRDGSWDYDLLIGVEELQALVKEFKEGS